MSAGDDSKETSGLQKTLDELEYESKVKDNEGKKKNNNFDYFPKQINMDKQGRHVPGHPKYEEGKSILTISIEEAQKLIIEKSGTGQVVNDYRERIDFGQIIGIYKSKNGNSSATTVGIIHYSKSGTHIIPAKPQDK